MYLQEPAEPWLGIDEVNLPLNLMGRNFFEIDTRIKEKYTAAPLQNLIDFLSWRTKILLKQVLLIRLYTMVFWVGF